MDIFKELLAYFGPRHWWPAETPLEVAVGALLTQNVAWSNVEKAINNLKERGLLSVDSLVRMPVEELALLIRPTRYYNQKAARLKQLVDLISHEFAGDIDKLFRLETNVLRERLLGLKGIGPETADSILLYAANRPVFVVDAYTRRIFSRLGYLTSHATYQEMQDFFTSHLPRDVYLFNEYHALIDGVGHHLCRANAPRCSDCPLVPRCTVPSGEDASVHPNGS